MNENSKKIQNQNDTKTVKGLLITTTVEKYTDKQ